MCIDGFSAQEPALLLSKCRGHYMHAVCILESFTAMGPKCPTCSTMYGQLHGEHVAKNPPPPLSQQIA